MILFLSFEIILYLEHYLYNKEMVEREREREIWKKERGTSDYLAWQNASKRDHHR